MDYYPLPSNAANVWLTGHTLHLGFPPTAVGAWRGHAIALEVDEAILRSMASDTQRLTLAERKTIRSLFLMVEALRARETDQGIGTKGAPIQYDLDTILKKWGGQIAKVGKKAAAKEMLTLEDLDL